MKIEVSTIGFTQKPAERFFALIRESGARRLIDVRLNNDSQLAGYAKRQDLPFFLRELCNVEYSHVPELAPTKQLLDSYKKHGGSWEVYAQEFLELMEKRRIESLLPPEELHGCCLLCSEHEPHHCHRRLVVDYLNARWNRVIQVRHLF